jgi:SPP1 family predicted phage head-tail adaptor
MKAGDLDRLIRIERAFTTSDGLGGGTQHWLPLATVWASKDDVSDGERVRAAEVGATIETRFRIRWGIGVTVQDRIVYDGRTFELNAVKEIGRHEGQELSGEARAE